VSFPTLTRIVEEAAKETLDQFATQRLAPEEFAITLLADGMEAGSYRGHARFYPASVVKLFYLIAAHRWLEDGKIIDSLELRRALRGMIVDSSNDATNYVVDLLTGTTGGPELLAAEVEAWEHKRNAINRYFHSAGCADINVNQKTWNEGPYGRERVFTLERPENRNALTTTATARLLSEIAHHRCVTPERSRQMLELLRRDPTVEAAKPSESRHAFFAPALPPGTVLYSKAGWTSTARHDAAYLELPNGRKIVLVVFTQNHSKDAGIIPTLAQRIVSALQ
jgi:beta-lactamase class A